MDTVKQTQETAVDQLLNQILSNRAVVIPQDDRPTTREVALAKSLKMLWNDLHPQDPRREVINELCTDGVGFLMGME